MTKNIFRDIDETPLDNLDLEWDSLPIGKPLLEVIKNEFKFDRMTPVQAATIPLMLKNKDVIVEAKTGSGKTLAFIIPIVEFLIRLDAEKPIGSHDVLAIILSPTRELAAQIHQELRKILRRNLLNNDRRLVSHLIVGGPSVASDLNKYTKYGGNIIVATPGRLSGIMEMADHNFSSCIRKKLSYLIFDEADQLLSFGFENDLSTILAYLPKQRRTSLFSATQTTEVEELAKSGLRNPIRINVNRLDSAKRNKNVECDNYRRLPMPDKLTNYFHVCESYAQKLAVLSELIRTDEYKKVLVFVSTCAQIDYFHECLKNGLTDKKITILKLHRRLKNKRKAIFKKFSASKRCVLLVTDILSRGIDIPNITCVIHLDLPASPECYVHRSGRSGHQIELSGASILLLEKHEEDYVEMCRRRQINLQPINLKHLLEGITESCQKLSSNMKKRATKDSDYQTLGLQAFVSYIRFYSAKLCLKDLLFPKLPIGQLIESFGLLKVPNMPELRKFKSQIAKTAVSEQKSDVRSEGIKSEKKSK